MVRYSLIDIVPFLLLGLMVMFGVSLAFTVLFNSSVAEEGHQYFPSIVNSLQTLFYACLGNFDEEVNLLTAVAILLHPITCYVCRSGESLAVFSLCGEPFCSMSFSLLVGLSS